MFAKPIKIGMITAKKVTFRHFLNTVVFFRLKAAIQNSQVDG